MLARSSAMAMRPTAASSSKAGDRRRSRPPSTWRASRSAAVAAWRGPRLPSSTSLGQAGAVVRHVADRIVQVGRIGRADGNRAPGEIELRVGQQCARVSSLAATAESARASITSGDRSQIAAARRLSSW
jgi:hypothetical protein